jgi:transcriptional regulator with XRE-family HTH domain
MDGCPSAKDEKRARVELTARRARYLEDIECARRGLSLAEARPELAARIGVPPGTLERLRRDTLKNVSPEVEMAIAAAILREFDGSIARCQSTARLRGGRERSAALPSAFLLIEAQQLIGTAA